MQTKVSVEIIFGPPLDPLEGQLVRENILDILDTISSEKSEGYRLRELFLIFDRSSTSLYDR
jgi:hypothetical protein